MTLIVILNIVLAALVLLAILGLLAWAIRSSRGLALPAAGRARRRAARPSYASPRSGARARGPVTGPAR